MIGKKKKIAKQELQEDKLVTTFYQSQEFIEEHKQKIFIGIGAVVVVVLALMWFVNKKTEDNLLASAQVSKIISTYELGDYQKSIDGEPGTQLIGLQKIVDEYGSTDQGEIAKIYLANSYYAIGDYENSINYYSDYSGNSQLHKASSLGGVAACYEQMGKFEDAADYYKKAAFTFKLDSQTSDFLLNAGINYIKADQKENAKNVLETLKNDYITTTAAREVDKYLSQL